MWYERESEKKVEQKDLCSSEILKGHSSAYDHSLQCLIL